MRRPARPMALWAASYAWAKHSSGQATKWCAVEKFGQSVLTFCSGRWPASDEYDTMLAPPATERCGACQRRLRDAEEADVAAETIGYHSLSEDL